MNDNDDLTTDLSRTLQDQAHSMDGSSLGLADVQGRARSIRRRRTATAVVGAAAAVALIVPTAALATHQIDRSNEPLPATNSVSPTPSETTSPDRQPAPGVLDVSDLPTGPAPRMDYVYDGRLHWPDGGVGDVNTRYEPDQFVELVDGSIVWHTSDENGTGYVEIRDPDGGYDDPVRTDSGVSTNSAHSIAAWVTPTGQVTIFEGWASQPRPLGDPISGSDLRVGPITGSADVAPGHPGPNCQESSCTVIVNVHDSPNQPWEVSESGSQPLTDGGYLDVNDVSQSGLTIGFTKITDSSTCSKLLGGGEFQGFSTCQHQLSSFSPDGRLIQALPSYFDGVGPGGIGMYDLEGTLLFERSSDESTQAFLSEATWEDDTHLVAPMFQDGNWAIVRVASDGSMEYAVAPVKGPYDRSPFVLPTGGALPGS